MSLTALAFEHCVPKCIAKTPSNFQAELRKSLSGVHDGADVVLLLSRPHAAVGVVGGGA